MDWIFIGKVNNFRDCGPITVDEGQVWSSGQLIFISTYKTKKKVILRLNVYGIPQSDKRKNLSFNRYTNKLITILIKL